MRHQESVAGLTLDDLKLCKRIFTAKMLTLQLQEILMKMMDQAFQSFGTKWKETDIAKQFHYQQNLIHSVLQKFTLWIFPGAKQSEIRIGSIWISFYRSHYFKATVMNYKLGGKF